MTMRAPPLASMAAVAAPSPDAEPVTIAHKPSFDIRISSCDWSWSFETHHIVPQNTCKSPKTPLRGINAGGRPLPSCRHCRGTRGHRRLSWQWLFPIMRGKKRRSRWLRDRKNEERRGGEGEHCPRDPGEDIFTSRRRANHQQRQERLLESAAVAGADRPRPAAAGVPR